MTQYDQLPLSGIRVIEFSQMVMGPACGVILGDLGADVIKIEPLKGDRTRYLGGIGSGFFDTFSRNKRSIALDIAIPEGREVAKKLIASSDVLIENFRPGLMKRSGFDYESVSQFAPKLIYCSLKGFLPGPYENRTALDEVVQMMGGLAFMTGPPGKPMRAGASVNDIMGGMFGVIAIQAALSMREKTGKGQNVQSALFENNVFLMGQAMMFQAVTGRPSTTWAVKEAPWPVYDLFVTKDEKNIFLAIVGEEHWQGFCKNFGREDWLADPALADSKARVAARDKIIPEIAAIIKSRAADELSAIFERIGLPFAPVNAPSDLLNDPHLAASGGLFNLKLDGGKTGKAPALPIILDGVRPPKRLDPPQVGEHTREVLAELDFNDKEIQRLQDAKVIGPG